MKLKEMHLNFNVLEQDFHFKLCALFIALFLCTTSQLYVNGASNGKSCTKYVQSFAEIVNTLV